MADFQEDNFEQKLLGLKDTQESIQSLSLWCLKHSQQHKKIVSCWLHVLKKGTFYYTRMCSVEI